MERARGPHASVSDQRLTDRTAVANGLELLDSMYGPAGADRFRVFREVSLWAPDDD